MENSGEKKHFSILAFILFHKRSIYLLLSNFRAICGLRVKSLTPCLWVCMLVKTAVGLRCLLFIELTSFKFTHTLTTLHSSSDPLLISPLYPTYLFVLHGSQMDLSAAVPPSSGTPQLISKHTYSMLASPTWLLQQCFYIPAFYISIRLFFRQINCIVFVLRLYFFV